MGGQFIFVIIINMDQEMGIKPSHFKEIVLIVVAVLIVGGLIFWYAITPEEKQIEPPASAPIENAALGGDIYEKSSNPIKNNLPDTVTPVPNPLQGIYQNPFE